MRSLRFTQQQVTLQICLRGGTYMKDIQNRPTEVARGAPFITHCVATPRITAAATATCSKHTHSQHITMLIGRRPRHNQMRKAPRGDVTASRYETAVMKKERVQSYLLIPSNADTRHNGRRCLPSGRIHLSGRLLCWPTPRQAAVRQ